MDAALLDPVGRSFIPMFARGAGFVRLEVLHVVIVDENSGNEPFLFGDPQEFKDVRFTEITTTRPIVPHAVCGQHQQKILNHGGSGCQVLFVDDISVLSDMTDRYKNYMFKLENISWKILTK